MFGSFSSFSVFFPLSQVWTLGGNTFTQLVRMKVFYFLLIFCVLILGSTSFVLQFGFEQELKMIKDTGLGAMGLFTSLFAIVSAALLIPKDLEDRTLYTILSKPVPRYAYLLGKFLGVFFLILVSLALMDVIFSLALWWRQQGILSEEIATLKARGMATAENLAQLRASIGKQGLTWSLQGAVVSILLKSAVVASFSLLISTFASSTLFTIVVSIVVFFIGHLQSTARAYWEHVTGATDVTHFLAGLVAIIFPDLQLFNLVDGVIAGQVLTGAMVWKLCIPAVFYLMVYQLGAWFFFSGREL